ERKSFLYPPYVRLVQLTFRHAKKENADKVSAEFVKLMKNFLDEKHLLGPEEPSIGRIKNRFIRKVFIKIPHNQSPKSIKNLIQKCLNSINTVQAYRSVRIDVDVDPY